jgi:hypothetical protein
VVFGLICLLAGSPIMAARSPNVVVDGQCPSEAATKAALDALLGDMAPADTSTAVVVRDLGTRYVVAAGRVEREVTDVDRRCGERAQAAAVIAVLAFRPPSVAIEEAVPDALSEPGLAPRVGVEVPPQSSLHIDVEALFALGGSPGQVGHGPLVAPGGEARVVVGGDVFGVSVGIGGAVPSVRELSTGEVRISRLQADAGVRLASGARPFELTFDLGLAASVLAFEGLNLPVSRTEVRLEPWFRSAAALRWWVSDAFAIAAAVEAWMTPRPNDVAIDPLGTVGSAGWLWIGGTLGALTRFD